MKDGWGFTSKAQASFTRRQHHTALIRTESQNVPTEQLWKESRQSLQMQSSTSISGWTVVYLKNRSLTSVVPRTPYELWHRIKPNFSHLRIIGSTAYVHVPKEKRIKLDTHSHKEIMIGYGGGMNQYKVWDLTRKDIVISRDVVFIEGKPVNQTPVAYMEEPRIIHNSITVLPEQSGMEGAQQPTPPPSEHPDPEEQELATTVDPQILLQDSATRSDEPREGAIDTTSELTHKESREGRTKGQSPLRNSQKRTSTSFHGKDRTEHRSQ